MTDSHPIRIWWVVICCMESNHLYGGDHVLITMGMIINVSDEDHIDGVDYI